jgi:hypothetical protein
LLTFIYGQRFFVEQTSFCLHGHLATVGRLNSPAPPLVITIRETQQQQKQPLGVAVVTSLCLVSRGANCANNGNETLAIWRRRSSRGGTVRLAATGLIELQQDTALWRVVKVLVSLSPEVARWWAQVAGTGSAAAAGRSLLHGLMFKMILPWLSLQWLQLLFMPVPVANIDEPYFPDIARRRARMRRLRRRTRRRRLRALIGRAARIYGAFGEGEPCCIHTCPGGSAGSN